MQQIQIKSRWNAFLNASQKKLGKYKKSRYDCGFDMELNGIEPMTSRVRFWRSPN